MVHVRVGGAEINQEIVLFVLISSVKRIIVGDLPTNLEIAQRIVLVVQRPGNVTATPRLQEATLQVRRLNGCLVTRDHPTLEIIKLIDVPEQEVRCRTDVLILHELVQASRLVLLSSRSHAPFELLRGELHELAVGGLEHRQFSTYSCFEPGTHQKELLEAVQRQHGCARKAG